jgi:enoyl-[acyl-carrier-protein] reductase (NADH)
LETYPDQIKAFFAKARKENLMGRFGTVEDVANSTMFLSSPLSAYTSGITQYVDGMAHLAGDRMGIYRVMREMIRGAE